MRTFVHEGVTIAEMGKLILNTKYNTHGSPIIRENFINREGKTDSTPVDKY